MKLAAALREEMRQEAIGTRKMLERLPADRFDWRPHPKSQTLMMLVSQLVEIPQWAQLVVTGDSYSLREDYRPLEFKDVAQALKTFDENMAAADAALRDVPDERLFENWRLLAKGREFFNMPRIGVLRMMVLNHAVHHRGQLSVYLRLLDVPLPPIYGPTADEQP